MSWNYTFQSPPIINTDFKNKKDKIWQFPQRNKAHEFLKGCSNYLVLHPLY